MTNSNNIFLFISIQKHTQILCLYHYNIWTNNFTSFFVCATKSKNNNKITKCVRRRRSSCMCFLFISFLRKLKYYHHHHRHLRSNCQMHAHNWGIFNMRICIIFWHSHIHIFIMRWIVQILIMWFFSFFTNFTKKGYLFVVHYYSFYMFFSYMKEKKMSCDLWEWFVCLKHKRNL